MSPIGVEGTVVLCVKGGQLGIVRGSEKIDVVGTPEGRKGSKDSGVELPISPIAKQIRSGNSMVCTQGQG